MVVLNSNNKASSANMNSDNHSEYHLLVNEWILWAHLPHNTDWTIKSYVKIATFKVLEDAIAVTENLPHKLIENCMLFIMKEGINPTWEDPQNRNGGFFSYKVISKNIYKCWKDLTYITIGNSLCNNIDFQNKICGITVSPKKNFSIVKVWMTDCTHQNAAVISKVSNLDNFGCLFKKHTPNA